jgi:hypothetical protein
MVAEFLHGFVIGVQIPPISTTGDLDGAETANEQRSTTPASDLLAMTADHGD